MSIPDSPPCPLIDSPRSTTPERHARGGVVRRETLKEKAIHRILVGTYRSRRDADDARTQLLDNGFDDAQIRVEGPVGDALARPNTSEAEPDSRTSGGGGIAGLIERMFSGFLPDEAERERYQQAMNNGGSLVAVHGLDDAATVRARPILERNGIVDEHRVEAQAWSPRAPDVNVLPNAPSGWNEAIDGSRAATGRGLQDPARPEGLTRGTNQLGTSEDRERIERGRTR